MEGCKGEWAARAHCSHMQKALPRRTVKDEIEMECVFIYSKACLPSQVCDRRAVLKFYSSDLAAALGRASELCFCM